jgi:hypothetical protein
MKSITFMTRKRMKLEAKPIQNVRDLTIGFISGLHSTIVIAEVFTPVLVGVAEEDGDHAFDEDLGVEVAAEAVGSACG